MGRVERVVGSAVARGRSVGRALWRHKVRTGAVLVAIFVVPGLLAVAWVRISTRDDVYDVASVPKAPVALVLGAGLRPDDTPTSYLRARLADAARLYRTGKVRVILVSGDHGRRSHDEVRAMADWLVTEHHVPRRKIVKDHAGFDTYDSCQRAHRIFGVDRAIVVTQGFHIRRAVFLCKQAGIETFGVASIVEGGQPWKNTIRELPAAMKAAWDAIVDPGPRYLGKHEEGVERALDE